MRKLIKDFEKRMFDKEMSLRENKSHWGKRKANKIFTGMTALSLIPVAIYLISIASV